MGKQGGKGKGRTKGGRRAVRPVFISFSKKNLVPGDVAIQRRRLSESSWSGSTFRFGGTLESQRRKTREDSIKRPLPLLHRARLDSETGTARSFACETGLSRPIDALCRQNRGSTGNRVVGEHGSQLRDRQGCLGRVGVRVMRSRHSTAVALAGWGENGDGSVPSDPDSAGGSKDGRR